MSFSEEIEAEVLVSLLDTRSCLKTEGAATQARLFLMRINFDVCQKHLPLFSIRVATQEVFMTHLFFRTSQ